ncbi:MAG: amino acid permease [Gammaproteobacteria bacterium RIFCSPHIGHO2_12_FULL_42_13]|nr:MAG: amino acid permease [Gammaproteobacteria bacterium RIFCSPHIGHO2_12_FULL_42_13]
MGLLWISLTSMIGSGWLFGSLYSAHLAGPAAIIAWPLAGFLLLFVALSFAEVATMFPQSGSLVRLPLYTHGQLTSVIMGGLAWISLATIPVIETQGLVQYASNYIPGLMVHYNATQYSSTSLGYLVAFILLISFVLLNYFGIRLFARINAGFTIWKLLIPSLTVILLLSTSYHHKDFSQYGGFMPYGWHGVMKAISSGGVFFSLLGFRQAVVMMSEIQNPGKYVPLVLVSSLLFTILLYTGLQWSFIGSMREQDLAHGWANLSFTGDAGPFAALAFIAGMTWLSILLYVDAFLSPYSTGLVYTTTASHMLASMGEMKGAPQSLAVMNSYNVPWLSLSVNFLLAAAMFYLLRGWQAMASFLVAAMMISYATGPICLICLRKQQPTQARPFRLRCGGLIAFIGFYVCTAGVYWSGSDSVCKLLILTAIGLLLYFLYYYFNKQSHQTLEGKNALWLLCYLIGLGIFSYLGNYGGKQLIPEYWDLFYLMWFSLMIFYLALFSTKPPIPIVMAAKIRK